jgi:hypothetical protein
MRETIDPNRRLKRDVVVLAHETVRGGLSKLTIANTPLTLAILYVSPCPSEVEVGGEELGRDEESSRERGSSGWSPPIGRVCCR